MDAQQLEFKSGIYHIRRLREEEALLYKSMRLEAIKTEPSMFRCTTPAEADLTDEQWQERIKAPRAVFGLFANDELVGMTSLLLLNDHEGYLGQSYIKKEHRGQGLSALLYKIRMALALELRLKRLSVSHRESNTASKAANQRFNFQYSHRETANWIDGTSEDVLYYVLDLEAN
ncbi:GNAT family N-acetyltransferase [Chitinophaga arvensicola]|uniref:Protein N-acetyltransferase, RimJ/RimL family n=1 Tax=Chitinophaga arvensicola TaxID=29529 RepID=A0A1I0SAN2_9BACT|nr:GNAT family N-acetyltransferase [Chitinophaga arvensicola]SEW53494.1 Protein N-acetyltransferase, RimJ/RimL family [Chitinophaga arvensicola]